MSSFRRIKSTVALLLVIVALFVSAESTFLTQNVQAAPGLSLTPTFGPNGSEVSFKITGFSVTDTTCSVSSTTSSAAVTFGACVVSGGIGNGTFIVGNVPPGDYVIRVTGSPLGDFAEQVFTVTFGASIVLIPSKGPTGTHVIVNGTGFLPSDTTCTISSPSSGSILVNPACSIVPPINGKPSNKTTGSFYVGNVPIGQYVIRVTGSPGNDFAEAVFNVTRGPQLILIPSKGPTGIHVSIEGGFFVTSDTTCSISSPSSGSIIQGAGCSVTAGSGLGAGFGNNVTGSFIVGNVPEGQYVIQVSGNQGDFAQAIFNVTRGTFIQLFPTKGPTGTSVNVEGSFFLSTDTTCSISSPSSGSIIQGAACTTFKVSSTTTAPGGGSFFGFMNVTGSFIVGNVLPGQYVVEVSGNEGDFAQAVFNVTKGPSITLSPASGRVGIHVIANGTNFLPTDTSCSISSPTSGTIILNGACSINAGTGTPAASFLVGNVPPGQYVIEISANQGDFATALFNVTIGPRMTLSPGSGRIGIHVTVNGTGFLPTDTSCSLSSPTSGSFITFSACAINAGSGAPAASFTVGNIAPGQYVVQINGNLGDFAQAVFNVTVGPKITMSPASGRIGIHVLVNGTGFLPSDSTCSISGPSSSIVTAAACSMQLGTGATGGSFTVGNVAPGQYVIQVTANQGDFAQAVFNITIGPTITLSPGSGRIGTHVLVNGTGFLPTDNLCSISSPSGGFILSGTGACSIVFGSGKPSGSFTVGNVAPGQYVIQVTGGPGNDFGQFVFNVTIGPTMRMSPASGAIGIHVLVNGTGFLPTDSTCTISSPGSSIVTAAACSLVLGTGAPGGSFTVGNVIPGQYVIQVTGNGGDFAQEVFNVTVGPKITLSQGTASPGIHINVNGTGFLPTDTTCVVSSPGSGAVLSGTVACVKQAGSSIVSGSFIVGNILPGQYIIQVTGNGGDFAQTILNVTGGPKLTLSAGTGTVGTEILVNGTGFLTTDQSCSISSTTGLFNPILSGSAACVMNVGTGIVRGSFIIGNVPPGEYVTEVTACAGNNGCSPSVGDFAQVILTVHSAGVTLTLFPTNATNGATVTFSAYGLSASDTGCVVQAVVENAAKTGFTVNTNLITSPTCSVITPTVAVGSFVVGPYATTNINWTVQVRGTPANDIPLSTTGTQLGAVFNVTASVYVTPPTGTRNTVFTFTGSGFSSTATTCQAHIYPPFPTVPPTLPPACYLSTNIGQVSGSIIVPGVAVPGSYGINVGDNKGHNATGIFTVGTPSALIVLNPAQVGQGQPVSVAGTGFNPNDTFCVITVGSGSTAPWSGAGGVAPICSISGGYASGAFTVSNTATGGYYLITLTGWGDFHKNNVTGGDFAQNFLGVNLASTITTFSSTSTTTTTATSQTVTTTSVATSYSYSSTTYSTTGILFTTYTHLTLTTVSGQTTTTASQSVSTTQTQTTVTVSTTTGFTTVSCGPLPCGYSIGSSPQNVNPTPTPDALGLLAMLLLLVPMLLRRLFP